MITGAAGNIGSVLRAGLRGSADVIRLMDLHPLKAEAGEEVVVGDVNQRSLWTRDGWDRIGYAPQDDAEAFAAAIREDRSDRFHAASSPVGFPPRRGEGKFSAVPPHRVHRCFTPLREHGSHQSITAQRRKDDV